MAKYNFINRDTNTASSFFSKLFEIRDTTHLIHLNQPDKTLATHLALGDLYEGLLGLTDELIETYQGLHGTVSIVTSQAKVQSPFQYVKDSYDWIDQNRGMFKESFLQNQIDEIQQLLAKTMYKLQFVK